MNPRKYYARFRFVHLNNTLSDTYEGVIELSKSVSCAEDQEIIKEILVDKFEENDGVTVLDVDLMHFSPIH